MHSYSGALEIAQRGHYVTRMKWLLAGKSIIVFIHDWTLVDEGAAISQLRRDLGATSIASTFACTTADGRLHFGWLPTHCDQLANDWVFLGNVASAVKPCMQRHLERYRANQPKN